MSDVELGISDVALGMSDVELGISDFSPGMSDVDQKSAAFLTFFRVIGAPDFALLSFGFVVSFFRFWVSFFGCVDTSFY